jgi:hypothetical protein
MATRDRRERASTSIGDSGSPAFHVGELGLRKKRSQNAASRSSMPSARSSPAPVIGFALLVPESSPCRRSHDLLDEPIRFEMSGTARDEDSDDRNRGNREKHSGRSEQGGASDHADHDDERMKFDRATEN